MPSPPPSDPDLETIAAVDRVARAAQLWLRREVAHGVAAAPGTRAHRELAAGLVVRLCERLQLDRAETLLAGYAVALLQSETDMAMDLPLRMTGTGQSADYLRGVAAAESLFSVLTSPPAAGHTRGVIV